MQALLSLGWVWTGDGIDLVLVEVLSWLPLKYFCQSEGSLFVPRQPDAQFALKCKTSDRKLLSDELALSNNTDQPFLSASFLHAPTSLLQSRQYTHFCLAVTPWHTLHILIIPAGSNTSGQGLDAAEHCFKSYDGGCVDWDSAHVYHDNQEPAKH
jgi:hypothetical protein